MIGTGKREREILDTAMKRLKRAVDADDHNRKAGIEDLKFANGDQWDNNEKKRRSDKGRPALQLNHLPKFIDQVVGDMLHNTPTIKVRPVDSRGDVNIAKIRQGIISNIEYCSNSRGIYSYAGKQQVTSGYGGWRVLTRYTEENPFLQEVYLESVRNPFLIYMDPTAKDQNYADAKWGFVLERMTKGEFEDRWPNSELPTKETFKAGSGLSAELWYDNDTVTVAEYFEIKNEKVKMHQLEDGKVVDDEELEKLKKDWDEKNDNIMRGFDSASPQDLTPPMPPQGAPPQGAPPMPPQGAPPAIPNPNIVPNVQRPGPGAPLGPKPPAAGPQPPAPSPGVGQPQAGPGPQQPAPIPTPPNLFQNAMNLGAAPKIVKTRETEKRVVRHRIISCTEIIEGGLEGTRFPGKHIPIVLVKGKELNIEGKNYVYSLIRHAKDPQKLINYWNTAAAETIALAPKAPWLGTAKQFENYENDYAAANVENFPFLKYNPDPEAPGPPQRINPAQPPMAIFEQIRRGEDNLKAVLGMFNADVGAPGSEQTGAAIVARQKPGDTGTMEFMENLSRAIAYTGRIINEMIPEIYDSERDVRIRNIDESESFVPINTTVGDAFKSMQKSPDKYPGMDQERLKTLFSKEGKDAKFNDVTVGKYDVVVTIGPSYATQRQESAQHLLQLVQAMPQQMAVASDLIVQNLDFKDSEELASRLRKPLIAQGITKPRPGEQQTPPPPSPAQQQMQMKMQVEQGKLQQLQMKSQMEQSKIQLQQVKVEQEKVRLEYEKVKMQAEIQKLQSELGRTNQTNQIDAAEKAEKLRLERDRLNLEVSRLQNQMQLENRKHRDKTLMDTMKHKLDQSKLAVDASMRMVEAFNEDSDT